MVMDEAKTEAFELFTHVEKENILSIKHEVNRIFSFGMPAMFNHQYKAGNIIVAGPTFESHIRDQHFGNNKFVSEGSFFVGWMLDADNTARWCSVLGTFFNSDSSSENDLNWESWSKRATSAGISTAYSDFSASSLIRSSIIFDMYGGRGIKYEKMLFYQTVHKTLDELLASPYIINKDDPRPSYMYKENFYTSRDSFTTILNAHKG